MLTNAQVDSFKENGYFILEDFLAQEEVNFITGKLDVYAENHQRQLAEVKQNHISRFNEISFSNKLAEQDPEIYRFVSMDKFLELGHRLIGQDLTLHVNQLVYKYPEVPRDFPWHQDNGYRVVDPEEYVSIWIALNDATVDNGCIRVLPQTHKQGTVNIRIRISGSNAISAKNRESPYLSKKAAPSCSPPCFSIKADPIRPGRSASRFWYN